MLLRITYITLLMLSFSALSFAGDDDKKGNGKTEKPKVVKKDTIFEVDVNKAASDDTLVFEDWEKPKTSSKDNYYTFETEPQNITSFPSENQEDTVSRATEPIFERSNASIRIYPNPTAHTLYFDTPIELKTVQILNLRGEIQNVKIQPQSIDVSNLPQGTYLIQLIFTDRIESRKFIKS